MPHRLLVRRDLLRTGLALAAGWVLGTGRLFRVSPGARTIAWPSAGPAQPVLAAPACVVRPAQTEGPYFVDERLNRPDIRSDPSDGTIRPGAPLRLVFNVSRVDGSACAPLAGALVDVWHCDALGAYSDVVDRGVDTRGKKFLRGYQVTDAKGMAEFRTIYPGWYQGRTVHIHFKIRTAPGAVRASEFTSQLYFDDAVSDQVYAQAPYASRGRRTTRNEQDAIFRANGAQLMLPLAKDGAGYAGSFAIGLQMP